MQVNVLKTKIPINNKEQYMKSEIFKREIKHGINGFNTLKI